MLFRSTLARGVDVPLLLGAHREACALGLAPTSTTTAMLALGDALALVVSEQRGFSREQFAQFHPAGSLGQQLTRVDEIMRPLVECRVANDSETVRGVLIQVGRPGRRTGAVMLVDTDGRLVGLFTDSDLARLLEGSHDSRLDRPISETMCRHFRTVAAGRFLPDALEIMAEHKISELPVVGDDGRPVGIIDVTDVMPVVAGAPKPTNATITGATTTGAGPVDAGPVDAGQREDTEPPRIYPVDDYRPTSQNP